VTRAVSGYELLEKLAEHGPFDFIVTDVSMPWMTGLQVLHSTQTAGLPIPVVVMTALRDQKTFDQAHALGEHATLLLKPFTLAQLFDALRGCVKHIGKIKTQPLARSHA
jgi:CheY-like chemotaxis protein